MLPVAIPVSRFVLYPDHKYSTCSLSNNNVAFVKTAVMCRHELQDSFQKSFRGFDKASEIPLALKHTPRCRKCEAEHIQAQYVHAACHYTNANTFFQQTEPGRSAEDQIQQASCVCELMIERLSWKRLHEYKHETLPWVTK